MNEKTQRLYDACKYLKGIEGQSNIARLFGVSSQVVKNWQDRGIAPSAMVQAELVVGCLAYWLETGKGSMTYAELDFSKRLQATVQKLTWDSAINWHNNFSASHKRIGVTCDTTPNSFALKIMNESNAPAFPLGASIVVEPNITPKVGQWGILHEMNAPEASLKQLVMDGATPLLKSGNPAYPLKPLNDSVWIGLVKQLIQIL
jgi:SOS-response transcriptional repressor LexA